MTSPLPKPFRTIQASVDADMRRVLEAAARNIQRRIQRLGVGIGAEVRAAQLRLALAQITRIIGTTWTGDVLDITAAGRKAAAEAAEAATETLTAVAYTALPPDVAKTLMDGLEAAAQSAIRNAFARVPRELSRRVYSHAALSQRLVSATITEGLASGLSARELAGDVYQYISPTTPGGMSYAAMRLSRTEINNAFHERQRAGGRRPGVKAVQWNLSGSHKVPDECNVYAAHKPYAPDDVPDKPHPQCFCFLTYIMMTPAEFQQALADGSFDDELDRRTKANIASASFQDPPRPVDRPRVVSTNKPKTGNAAHAIVPKGLFKEGTLTDEQARVLRLYETGGGFRAINSLMRSGGVVQDRDDERTMHLVNVMDAAMANSILPEPIQTHRGMYRARRLFGDSVDGDLTGFKWQDQGYGSTTTEEDIARQFSPIRADPDSQKQTVRMIVHVPAGIGALQISTDKKGSMANGAQAEICLQRNLFWTIIKDHGMHPDGYRLVEAKVSING